MHVFVATQINHKVYDRELSELGPRTGSTRFMCEAVKQVERWKLLHGKVPKQEDTIWKNSKGNTTKEKKSASTEKPTCHNCGKPGHLRKDCKTCPYCKIYGHAVKDCRKRIAEAKGKFCAICNITDSHDTKECKKKVTPKKSVKTLQPEAQAENQAESWDPTTCDETGQVDATTDQY